MKGGERGYANVMHNGQVRSALLCTLLCREVRTSRKKRAFLIITKSFPCFPQTIHLTERETEKKLKLSMEDALM